MFKKINKSLGRVSAILLILAVVLIIVIIVVFVAIKINQKNANSQKFTDSTNNENQPPKPVYDTTIGDVRFVFESAVDLGGVLKSKNAGYQENLTTTERFIKVTIGAQNKGKVNIERDTWDVGNIVDSDGRNFVSINDQAYFLLPQPSLCGAMLKPEFEPIGCIKLYEVSKKSTKLKVEVNVTNQNSSKKQKSFIDLIVQ